MAVDTNEPAFPVDFRSLDPSSPNTLGEELERRRRSRGMTLRDYFAGQALPGIMARGASLIATDDFAGEAARLAYEVADAMLAERAK